MDEWLDIVEYRDFHDVPRIFMIIVEGRTFMFDCPFDEKLDEYPDEYRVYEMSEMLLDTLPDDWTGLSRVALNYRGKVDVRRVVFDNTRRKQINSTLLSDLFMVE